MNIQPQESSMFLGYQTYKNLCGNNSEEVAFINPFLSSTQSGRTNQL